MLNLTSLRENISRRYSIVEIIKNFVTDQFQIVKKDQRTKILNPCPFSGVDNSFVIIKGSNGSESFYRFCTNYIDEEYRHVPQEGMAYELLSGLFPDDSPIQLIRKLQD